MSGVSGGRDTEETEHGDHSYKVGSALLSLYKAALRIARLVRLMSTACSALQHLKVTTMNVP